MSRFSSRRQARSRFLCLRPARAASAHMDERDSFLALFARPRRWSLAQQRARRAGSSLQSQIRFHAHAQVRHRTQIATVAKLQIQTAQIGAAAGGAGLSRFISPTSFGSRLCMDSFISIPFLLMFQGGFLYVCLSSLASRWPKISFGSSRAATAISA